jgi:hypothetical protein
VLQTLSTAATSNGIPAGYRLDQTNSFYPHGIPGISDSLGSALWALEFSFDNAQNGSSGINFHGGRTGMDAAGGAAWPFAYAPIAENGMVSGVNPLFYGMLFMSLAGTGDVLATSVTNNPIGHTFTAHAIGLADGSMNIVLRSTDQLAGMTVNVDIGAPVTAASAIYLQGPIPPAIAHDYLLYATSGITLAGSGISPTGAWKPNRPFAVSSSGNVVTVGLPPSSAALVHVQ